MIQNFVIIAHPQSKYMVHVLHDGSSCVSRTLALPDRLSVPVENKYIIAIDNFDANILPQHDDYTIININNTTQELIHALIDIDDKKSGHDKSHTCVTWADNMLQYAPLYHEIFELHTKYHAHYSFAEGYPIGVSPEFLSHTAINMLHTIISKETSEQLTYKITRESLFKVIELRLNDFDVEALLAQVDMRDLRISFVADTRRNFIIGKRVIEDGVENPNDVALHYQNNPQRFRGVPSYVYAQVSSREDWCIYKPEGINNNFYQDKELFVSLEDWELYLNKLQEFSPEAVLCIGYNGEPAYHPNIGKVLELATKYFSRVYVETHGREWGSHMQESWWKESWIQQISWIISMDAFEESTYERIHRTPQKTAISFINFIYQFVDKKNIYVQCVRMIDNEKEIEAFMEYWTNEEVNPIIQKYNDYCGNLPQRKVIDISPIKRNACFHLSRDLVLLLDGRIAMCAQAISQDNIIGDINKDTLEHIWGVNDHVFSNQVKNKYTDICRSCDEYYTVNE